MIPKLSKALSLLVAIAICAPIFAGCAANSENLKADKPLDTDPVSQSTNETTLPQTQPEEPSESEEPVDAESVNTAAADPEPAVTEPVTETDPEPETAPKTKPEPEPETKPAIVELPEITKLTAGELKPAPFPSDSGDIGSLSRIVSTLSNTLPLPEKPLEEAYGAVNGFSFDFFKKVISGSENENSIMSALSAYYALGMLSAGTNGATADELEAGLGLSVSETAQVASELMTAYNTLSEETTTALNISNGVFMADRLNTDNAAAYGILDDYYAAESYKGTLHTEAAKNAINQWVNDRTDGMIPAVFNDPLPQDTIMVLINTIFLDAKWRIPFTNFGGFNYMSFTLPDGTVENVECLSDERGMEYISTSDAIGAILDYADGRLKFAAIMPRDGDMESFISDLDYERFSGYIDGAKSGRCVLRMPKFSIESSMNLNDVMKSMGMTTMFDESKADLSGFGTSESGGNIYVSRIFQKARIDVDEDGTRAAAATVIAACDTVAIRETVNITLDHSFFYCIYDSETGVPLFMGVMARP